MTQLMLRLALLLALVSGIVMLALLSLGQRTPVSVVAYALQPKSNISDIYLVDVRTQVQANLTHTVNSSVAQPVWSPDGRRLVYYRLNGTSSPAICMFDGATKCYASDAVASSALRWSPDSQKIAYRDDFGTLTALDLDSGAVVYSDINDHPSYWQWSPDGSRFVITSCSRGTGCTVDLENGDLSAFRSLYQSSAIITSSPTWSPDGKKLLFSVAESGHPSRIDLLDVASGSLINLTDVEG